jgi:hypothetical protein
VGVRDGLQAELIEAKRNNQALELELAKALEYQREVLNAARAVGVDPLAKPAALAILLSEFAKRSDELHTRWSAAVGKPGYVKSAFLVEENVLGDRYRHIAEALGHHGPLISEPPDAPGEMRRVLASWPDGEPPRYNGSGDPCDAWIGACCCGATHLASERQAAAEAGAYEAILLRDGLVTEAAASTESKRQWAALVETLAFEFSLTPATARSLVSPEQRRILSSDELTAGGALPMRFRVVTRHNAITTYILGPNELGEAIWIDLREHPPKGYFGGLFLESEVIVSLVLRFAIRRSKPTVRPGVEIHQLGEF